MVSRSKVDRLPFLDIRWPHILVLGCSAIYENALADTSPVMVRADAIYTGNIVPYTEYIH